jgi:hypothetical protein
LVQSVLDWMYTGYYETEVPDPERKSWDQGKAAWDQHQAHTPASDDSAADDQLAIAIATSLELQASDETSSALQSASQSAEKLPAPEDTIENSQWKAYYVSDWSDEHVSLTAAQNEISLKTHLHLYLIADRLNVTSLITATKEKFTYNASYNTSEPFFPKILSHLLENTTNKDELRNSVLAQCLGLCSHVPPSDLTQQETIINIIETHEPAFTLYAMDHAHRLRSARYECETAHATTESLGAELKVASESRDDAHRLCDGQVAVAASAKATLTDTVAYLRKGNFTCKSCGNDLLFDRKKGCDIGEISTDPAGVLLDVPRLYVQCDGCGYKQFMASDAQASGKIAYASNSRTSMRGWGRSDRSEVGYWVSPSPY